MAKKNYTEYERDLKDFQKNPLSKDQGKLIFPPEINIKESDGQDPSVLPATLKLSMRKKAQFGVLSDETFEQIYKWADEIEYLIDEGYEPDEAYLIEMEKVRKENWFVYLNARDALLYVLKERGINISPKIASKKLAVSIMRKKAIMRKRAQFFGIGDVFEKKSDGSKWEITELDDTGYEDVYLLVNRDTGKEVQETKSEMSEPGAAYERIEIRKNAVKKTSSKKLAVGDEFMTPNGTPAKVVDTTPDLVIWVAVDGDDFGSDFIGDIEEGGPPYGHGFGPREHDPLHTEIELEEI